MSQNVDGDQSMDHSGNNLTQKKTWEFVLGPSSSSFPTCFENEKPIRNNSTEIRYRRAGSQNASQVTQLPGSDITWHPKPLPESVEPLEQKRLTTKNETFPDLEWLSMANNSLTLLPADVFGSLSSLKHLDLGHNRLLSLPNNIFRYLKNLKVCCLSSERQVMPLDSQLPCPPQAAICPLSVLFLLS